MHDPKTTRQLMTIGAFSRRTRLSYKALRLYDAMGLLPPEFVDPDSGYRYYGEEQVDSARLIGLLRQLEMPLDHIDRVLGLGGTEAARAVASYWRDVEVDIGEKRQLVRYLENYLQGKGDGMYQVENREVPEQKVVSIQGHVKANELPGFIQETMGRLYDYVLGAGLEPQGFPFVVYHGLVDVDSDGPVETCVAFDGDLGPKEDISVRIEPGHREAFTRISKGQVEFPKILEAYDAVGRHLQEQGKTAGAPREVYIADWNAIGDDDPACDIAFPYEG